MKTNYLKFLLTTFTLIIAIGVFAQGSTCEEATVVTAGDYTVPIIEGTGASNVCFGTGGTGAAWYSYTAVETGPVIVTSTFDAALIDTRVSVYSGACDALVCVAQDDDMGDGFTSLLTVDAIAGETYLIEWDDRWSAEGFDFSIIENPSAPDCATLTFPEDGATEVALDETNFNSLIATWDLAITGETPSAIQIFLGTDPAELNVVATVAGSEVSFTFFNLEFGETYYWAAIPNTFGIDAAGCDIYSFSTAFMEGDTDGDGVLDDFDCAPEDAEVYLGAPCDDTNPETFNDQIQEDCTCEGVVPEPGELCDIAIEVTEGEISCPGPATGSGAANNCFAAGGINAYWYSYTPSQDGQVTISSSNDPNLTDTRLSVYTGECGALECLDFDDDGGEGFTSVVTTLVNAGSTYYIEWDDNWSPNAFDFEITFIDATGDVDLDGIPDIEDNCIDIANADQLDTDGDLMGDLCDFDDDNDFSPDSVDCAPLDVFIFPGAPCDDSDPETFNDIIQEGDCTCAGALPPPNFECPTAIAVEADVVIPDPGPFAGASANNGCFGDGGTNSNWYTYTPDELSEITVNSGIDPNLTDTRLSIYEGDCDSLICVASSDDEGEGFTSIVTFVGEAGVTYYVEWDDRWSINGFDWIITAVSGTTDTDGDGIVDLTDNCVDVANEDQADLDIDGIGDLCDDDIDGDFVSNAEDCDPMDVLIFPGATCDDGNAETVGDIYQLADCVCAGVVPEEGDVCSLGIPVSEGTFTAPGPDGALGASNVCFGDGASNATWYAYTASANGVATVSSEIDPNLNDTRLSVYTGDCDALSCLVSSDDDGEGFTSVVNFEVTEGSVYYIEWDDRWSPNGFDFLIDILVGIQEIDGATNNVELYPNPVNDIMNVRYIMDEAAAVTYEIYDVSGKLLYSDIVNNASGFVEDRISTKDLVNGLYILKIYVGEQQITKKFNVIR